MKVAICIGSSCHIKGSRQVIESLQSFVAANKLDEQVALYCAFCIKNCVNGVSVTEDEQLFSITPETVKDFLTRKF